MVSTLTVQHKSYIEQVCLNCYLVNELADTFEILSFETISQLHILEARSQRWLKNEIQVRFNEIKDLKHMTFAQLNNGSPRISHLCYETTNL